MSHGSARARARTRGPARIGGTALAVALIGLISVSVSSATTAPQPWQRPATPDEYALLLLANQARAAQSPPINPMIWNDALGESARAHTYDMVTNGCFQHDSCNGEVWWKRVQGYYPGWIALGENISEGGTPQQTHDGWMASPGHRANILNDAFSEFGSAFQMDHSDFHVPYSTEDFGSRGLLPLNAMPAIPAAAVLVPVDYTATNPQWTLALNFFDSTKHAPADVHAVVDGTIVPLTLNAGVIGNGTYTAPLATPSYTDTFCKKVYFSVRRNDGQTFRWPATGFVGLGFVKGCSNTWLDASTPPPTTSTTTTTAATTTTTASTTTTTTVPNNTGAPKVTIQSPSSGATLRSAVVVRATATDSGKVTAMELWIDGKRTFRRQGATLAREWNARAASVKAGMHTIAVKAYDDRGNVGMSSMVVKK